MTPQEELEFVVQCTIDARRRHSIDSCLNDPRYQQLSVQGKLIMNVVGGMVTQIQILRGEAGYGSSKPVYWDKP
jgi:hypothetical protein